MDSREMKKYSLLAEVATDYYERKLSQSEIADRLCLDRTRVSRLLREAEEKGIVQIEVSIHYPFERHYELEKRLLDRFPLKEARVLNNRICPPDSIQKYVGVLASSYIMEKLKKDMVIGTAWGTTLSDTIQALVPSDFPVHVVQLMGSVPCVMPSHTPQAIVANMAELFHGKGNFLNMPLYVEDDHVREVLSQDPNNRVILNMGMFSDMILSNMNDLDSIREKHFWSTYLTDEMLEEIRRKDGVGAMLARFFDENGEEIDCAWNQRTVGIPLREVRHVPTVMAIASGKHKARAITCAMKSGLVNTLVTDGSTASVILGLRD